MAFWFSERHIEEYERAGCTVFRGILPPTLIDDLRRVTDQGRELARQQQGPQTQRLQPVCAFDIDPRPFENYRDLPPLRDALARLFGPEFEHGNAQTMGVLLEPREQPYCTPWHRDWRDNIPGLDIADWQEASPDRELFNQINCALYEDSCTWIVPGSHAREDLPQEIERFPTRPILGPDLNGQSSATRERECLEYCASMPGARRLHLDAGDFAVYRNSLWHLGNYVPYRKRATLHDTPDTARFRAWRDHALAKAKARREQGLEWENPNPQPAVTQTATTSQAAAAAPM